jgi:hypothetical protein
MEDATYMMASKYDTANLINFAQTYQENLSLQRNDAFSLLWAYLHIRFAFLRYKMHNVLHTLCALPSAE